MQAPSIKTRIAESLPLILATLIVSSLFIIGFNNHGPIPSMETRFAVIVQQMLAHNVWLVPQKNTLPYFDYPPFYYWSAMLLNKLGVPLLPAIRIPNLLALLLWVFTVWKLAPYLIPKLPRWLLPVAILVCPAILYNFFVAQTDGWLMAGVALALLGYVRAREKAGFPWLLALGTMLSVSAKGPVGLILVGLALGGDLLLAGKQAGHDWKELLRTIFRFAPIRCFIIAIAPLAAWYIACGLTQGWGFVEATLLYNNVMRYVAGAGGNNNSSLLFLTSIWGDYFPYSLALPFGIYLAIKQRREAGPRLLLVWSITTLVFFSLSASKQTKYILPAAPAFVALGLIALHTALRSRSKWLTRGVAIWSYSLLIILSLWVAIGLPKLNERLDNNAQYAKLDAVMRKAPGRIFMYQWPRALILYQLGAPMPWFRSSRELYQAVRSNVMRSGDYLLIYKQNNLWPPAGRPYPYFEYVTYIKSKGGIYVYRVLPHAHEHPMPWTDDPPEMEWWEQFDLD